MDFIGGDDRLLRPQHDRFEKIEVKGFGEIVVGPAFHRFDGILHRRFGGHDHHRHAGALILQRREEVETVDPRHLDVENGKVMLVAARKLESF